MGGQESVAGIWRGSPIQHTCLAALGTCSAPGCPQCKSDCPKDYPPCDSDELRDQVGAGQGPGGLGAVGQVGWGAGESCGRAGQWAAGTGGFKHCLTKRAARMLRSTTPILKAVGKMRGTQTGEPATGWANLRPTTRRQPPCSTEQRAHCTAAAHLRPVTPLVARARCHGGAAWLVRSASLGLDGPTTRCQRFFNNWQCVHKWRKVG